MNEYQYFKNKEKVARSLDSAIAIGQQKFLNLIKKVFIFFCRQRNFVILEKYFISVITHLYFSLTKYFLNVQKNFLFSYPIDKSIKLSMQVMQPAPVKQVSSCWTQQKYIFFLYCRRKIDISNYILNINKFMFLCFYNTLFY